jgi:UDP-glucose 4-epimerase
VDFISFRLANIYGPRNLSGPIPTFYKRLTAGEPCTIVDSRRDFVFIDDLVDLVTKAIDEWRPGIYHAASGGDFSIDELFGHVLDAVNPGTWRASDQPRGKDDAATIRLDPSQTMLTYGWKPTTPLRDGIAKAVDWYREHGVGETYTHLSLKG